MDFLFSPGSIFILPEFLFWWKWWLGFVLFVLAPGDVDYEGKGYYWGLFSMYTGIYGGVYVCCYRCFFYFFKVFESFWKFWIDIVKFLLWDKIAKIASNLIMLALKRDHTEKLNRNTKFNIIEAQWFAEQIIAMKIKNKFYKTIFKHIS